MISKYRAIPIDKPKDSGEFVYGFYVFGNSDKIHYISPLQTVSHYADNSFRPSVNLIAIHPDTVGQYTGLKETCGGDIITFVPSDGSTKVKQKATILYDELRTCFMADSNAWYIPLSKCRQIEVIGTIHDKAEGKE